MKDHEWSGGERAVESERCYAVGGLRGAVPPPGAQPPAAQTVLLAPAVAPLTSPELAYRLAQAELRLAIATRQRV